MAVTRMLPMGLRKWRACWRSGWCYHQACDVLDNVNVQALDRYTDAVAGTVAYFTISASDLPVRD
jgi:hypothetical protein